MIPKVIHYCWFGENKKSALVKKCIKSWRRYCPDFEIREWNESNYDLTSAPLFVHQALKQRKYAFATDYIRFQLVYEYGGIYLDTDVQLIKPLDEVLANKAYFGLEKNTLYVNTGLGFGAEPGSPIIAELMHSYESISFMKSNGNLDLTPNTIRDLCIFQKHGLIMNGSEQLLDEYIHIYPEEYFSPGYVYRQIQKTEKTISIHWWTLSWISEEDKQWTQKKRLKILLDKCIHTPNRYCRRILGDERYEILKYKLRKRSGRGRGNIDT